MHELGLTFDNAINKHLIIKHGNMLPGPIIRITKDFHFESLHNSIKPLIIEFYHFKLYGYLNFYTYLNKN